MADEEKTEKKPPLKKKPGLFAKFGRKDGKFSKTATITSVSWFIVLSLYTVQSLFMGTTVTTEWFAWTVPAFNATAAGVLLSLSTSGYLGNNYLKGKASNTA